MADTLVAEPGTIQEVADQASQVVEEQLTAAPEVETDDSGDSQETDTLEDPLAGIDPKALAEHPEVKKLLEAELYRVRQSEGDKARAAEAERRRSDASLENRRLVAQMLASEYQKAQTGEGSFDQKVFDRLLVASTAHAETVAYEEFNDTMGRKVASMFPDYRPDPNDIGAWRNAFNARNAEGMSEALINMAVKAGISRHDQLTRAEQVRSREELGTTEKAAKAVQTAAKAAANPTRRPTPVNGTTAATKGPQTRVEADAALASGGMTLQEFKSAGWHQRR